MCVESVSVSWKRDGVRTALLLAQVKEGEEEDIFCPFVLGSVLATAREK